MKFFYSVRLCFLVNNRIGILRPVSTWARARSEQINPFFANLIQRITSSCYQVLEIFNIPYNFTLCQTTTAVSNQPKIFWSKFWVLHIFTHPNFKKKK